MKTWFNITTTGYMYVHVDILLYFMLYERSVKLLLVYLHVQYKYIFDATKGDNILEFCFSMKISY